ncbi:MAG: D-aminoacyl-tRNA deacylase [Thermodesulfobacteriota bacterium]|nr:D-aminoacyl-tRNA deacylase [Thermodesulfobacteriota bacterium]
MRAVAQRVSRASVSVNNKIIGSIDKGLVILLGVSGDDTKKDVLYLADKITHLRIFADDNEKMNLSLQDIQGEMLIVSQFTLYGDCRKGRRPSYSKAANPEKAKLLYQSFIDAVQNNGIRVATGEFQAMMEVNIINDGPVTILLDSNKLF